MAKYYRLAREFPDGITNKNLRNLAADLEHRSGTLIAIATRFRKLKRGGAFYLQPS